MRRPRPLATVLVAVWLATGCTGGDDSRIRTARVARADVVEVVNAPAAVAARATATVTAPADATVVDVLVKDGQAVVAGVPLVRLDSPAATAQLAAARAAADLATTDAQRQQAAAALVVAQRTVDGLLVRAPIAGAVQLGGSAPGGAAAGVDALIGQLPAAIQGQAASALGTGPASGGTTTVTVVERGVPVQRGTVLAVVFDLSALSLVAEVDETDVLLVRPGVAADVELDAAPDATYRATVRSVELAPTTSSRGGVTYRVVLELGPGHAPDGSTAPTPRPGMSAVADLRVREVTNVVAVPAAAVVRRGARDAVWVVADGRARATVVTLGAQGDEHVEIRDGVDEGDEIVVSGADLVREGQEV